MKNFLVILYDWKLQVFQPGLQPKVREDKLEEKQASNTVVVGRISRAQS